ncbi:MAG: 50S ribosomal protein L23 [Bacteroidales bacterium]|nr:50S ribosomal protein L23 [Bacteroidales bacterium]
MGIEDIIIRPIITEKMTNQGQKLNKYGFIVHKNANKIQIAKAIEKLYNVKVEKVNTIIQRGKRIVRYTKTGFSRGRKPFVKKAYVTLKENYKIDFFSNI